MTPIKKLMALDKIAYYETHLALVNALLPAKMTPKEIEVLARFMGLEGDIALDRFGTSAKKLIKEGLKLSDGGLGNYMKSLKDKRFIIDVNGTLKVHPLLQNDGKEQLYQFKLVNKSEINESI